MLAPFPYFGGKGRVAAQVWHRLGNVPNFVEPFAGSAAVLLARPDTHAWWERVETISDADGMISNFWRAVQAAPDEVAHWADWPVNENDLHARHAWLVGQRAGLTAKLEGTPDYYDAKVAGWWLWGICQWIGSGWCSGEGPWQAVGGRLVDTAQRGGTRRKLPHLGNGQGVNRQRPHLGDAGQGVNRQLPHLGDAGRGVNRKLPHLGNAGQCDVWSDHLRDIMSRLRDRLRRVRVCSGDWSRVCGPSPTHRLGLTGVFLDPPYSVADRADVYSEDSRDVAMEVAEWCRANGDNPLLRIALCGYAGEHELPGWERWQWKARGGYGSQGNGQGRANAGREVVWFSPHCLRPDLFSWAERAAGAL